MKRENIKRGKEIDSRIGDIDGITEHIEKCEKQENAKDMIFVTLTIKSADYRYSDKSRQFSLDGEMAAIIILHLKAKYENERTALLKELETL